MCSGFRGEASIELDSDQDAYPSFQSRKVRVSLQGGGRGLVEGVLEEFGRFGKVASVFGLAFGLESRLTIRDKTRYNHTLSSNESAKQ
jgi:hypothetical protein